MEEKIKDNISYSVEENLTYIKELLKDVSDVVYREFYIKDTKAVLLYIDGLADKVLLNDFVLESVLKPDLKVHGIDEIKNKILTVTDIKEVKKLSQAINGMLSGDTMMIIDNNNGCFVIASRAWPNRGVSEPSGETVVKGPREGFTETIRFNTVLIRRRIRDTRLKVKPKSLGVRSKTDSAIMYIEDIVNKPALEEVMRRLDTINVDAVLDSSYVEQLIEDNKWSPFPQVQATERPDVVAAALYEGRIAILVDCSPFAIIVPATLPNLFQSPDDYNIKWMHASIVRLIRLFAIIMALILPALYVAVTSFHTAIIPTKLALSIAASREGVPFPAFIETIIMEISLALLMEAIVRLPKPIGATIGIVGGLIIGQAAVSAGIVSPIMIIIVALTVLTTFITPNYEVALAFRISRFLLIIAAAVIGLYGIMLGLIVLLIHLARLNSFGIPYLAPSVNTEVTDLKDLYIRYPFRYFIHRPKYMNTGDKIRQK